MLVTTATVGVSFRNERSDSSASATMNSPLPELARPSRSTPTRPPTTTVGRARRASSTVGDHRRGGGLAVAPATATPYFRRISSASISARGITGTPARRASMHLGVVGADRGRGDHDVRARDVRRGVAVEHAAARARPGGR